MPAFFNIATNYSTIKNILLLILAFAHTLSAQTFSIAVQESSQLTNVPAIHSGAYAQWNGKWVFIGGRKNGLHGFQPPFAFPQNGINGKVYVLDVAGNQLWQKDVSSLAQDIREAITTSNMQFAQRDSVLYMAGGYGWNDTANDFRTYPTLTAVNLPGLVDAVINNQSLVPHFRQVVDQRLAVCGSHLQMIDTTFYLVFGHRFDGRYDRIDTSGYFLQQYTNEIRSFGIADDGNSLSMTGYSAQYDSLNFHRRDLNLLPQFTQSGQKFLCSFGGVFQYDADLPYLNPIRIYPDSVVVSNDEQQLSQYHSAVAAVYDSASGTQHNLFFGGMGLYFIDSISGNAVQDTAVPFVRTVSNMIRDANNQFTEMNTTASLPALLGTNAYFLPAPNAPMLFGECIHLTALPENSLIGYVIGGIESPEANINHTDPTLSFAGTRVLEVWLDKTPNSVDELKPVADAGVRSLQLFPNPAKEVLNVRFLLTEQANPVVSLCDLSGKRLQSIRMERTQGAQQLSLDVRSLPTGSYLLTVSNNGVSKSLKWRKK